MLDDPYLKRIKDAAAQLTLDQLRRGIAHCESQRFPTAASWCDVPFQDLKEELDRRILPDSEIPRQYSDAEITDFPKAHAEVLERFLNGKAATLLLYGIPGTGKSRSLYALARRCIKARRPWRIETAPIMLRDLRSAFDRGGEYDAERAIRTFDGFLAVDEIGQGRQTEYTIDVIESIINDREKWGRPLAVATNLDISEISKTLSDRIADRLAGGIVLHFTGTSRRWGQK